MEVTVTKRQGKDVVVKARNNNAYIRLTQKVVISEVNKQKGTSITKIENRSALLFGDYNELTSMNYKEGDTIPGKIIVIESTTPFDERNPAKDYKIAGETGVVCTYQGQPIYRRNIFTTNINLNDILVQHDNQKEISNAINPASVNKEEEMEMELEHTYIDPDFNFDD